MNDIQREVTKNLVNAETCLKRGWSSIEYISEHGMSHNMNPSSLVYLRDEVRDARSYLNFVKRDIAESILRCKDSEFNSEEKLSRYINAFQDLKDQEQILTSLEFIDQKLEERRKLNETCSDSTT